MHTALYHLVLMEFLFDLTVVWVVEYVTEEMKEKVCAQGEEHVFLIDLLVL